MEEQLVHKGKYYDGDIYEQIKRETGLDIKNNPDYRIGFVGAEDDLGVSETLYSDYYVYRKKKGKILIDPYPYPKPKPVPPGDQGGLYGPGGTRGSEGKDNLGGYGGPEVPRGTDNPDDLDEPIVTGRTDNSDDLDESIVTGGTNNPDDIEGPEGPEIPGKIKKLIDDYVSDTEEKESKFIRVTRKYANFAKKWLCLLALILVLLSGLKKDPVQNIHIESITKTSIGYEISFSDGSQTSISEEDLNKILYEMGIGSDVNLKNNDRLYHDSLLNKPVAVIGKGIRQEGNYKISGISIVNENKIIAYEVDLDIKNPGLTIGDYVKQVCEKYNLDPSKVDIRIHIGAKYDKTITGWIDISKLLNVDHLDQNLINEIIEKNSTYKGNVDNFEGSTITIKTDNGNVTIPVKDANGNFYQPGTKVIGSDGKEYLIQELNIKKETTQTEKEVVTGEKLTWKIQNCNLALGLAPLLAALATEIITKKKNEEAQKNPKFYEFENEAEYQKFKKEFEDRKKEYEKKSGFGRMIKEIFWRKEVDLLQTLTDEQVREIYAAIKNCHNGDYSYNKNDKIEFKNGKIIVTFTDGRKMDITDIILPSIASIGKENPIVTEGLLPEDEEKKVGKK